MAMQPMAMYGLEVPCGDVAISARPDVPSAFRITMAAIDPSAEPEGEKGLPPRATLKIIRQALDLDDEDDESDDGFDQEEMERILREEASDESDEDDEGMNGGPSDPSKSKMAKRAAAEKKIKELLEAEGMDVDDDDEDDDEDEPNGVNGIVKSAKAKGKMPASDSDSDEDDEDMDDEGEEFEEFVVCTLDPSKLYQQPLDITIGDDERVWFKVSGTHSIFLTGNYVEPAGDAGMYDPDSDEDEEYDLEPDMDEIDDEDMDEVDELDDMDDPRVVEVDEDEDEAPALIKASKKNGVKANKNKRPAPDSADEDEADAGAEGLDEMMAKEAKAAVNGDKKLTKQEKRELKKLKKNDGTAAASKVDEKKEAEAPSSNKSDKKVSFAKELEQGPTPTKAPEKSTATADAKSKSTASLGVKTVQGVTVDDKKLGNGQAAKNGDRVSMRYIGKLKDNNKVFDSNKKGAPFRFNLGSGEVIKGWEIGVQGMQVGGERRITIPAHLAYGSKRAGDIPPNSTLVFDIKVLDIQKK